MVDVIHARGMNDEVWRSFKQAVIGKHGKLHGVLGKELTKAMKLYLEGYSQEEHTHTRVKEEENKEKELKKEKGDCSGSPMCGNGNFFTSIGKISDGEKKIRMVISRMKENRAWENLEMNIGLLERFIKEIAGHDKRTVKKYRDEIFKRYENGL